MSISEYVNFVGSFFLGGGGCVCVLRLRGRRGILRNEGGLEGWWSGCDGDWVAASSCQNGGAARRVELEVPIGCGGGGDGGEGFTGSHSAWDTDLGSGFTRRALSIYAGRGLWMQRGIQAVPEGSGSGDSASETQHGAAYQGAVHQQGSIAAV